MSEFDSGVNVDVLAGVDGTVDVVHVAEEIVRYGFVLFSRDIDGLINGVIHPHLRDDNHQTWVNRP